MNGSMFREIIAFTCSILELLNKKTRINFKMASLLGNIVFTCSLTYRYKPSSQFQEAGYHCLLSTKRLCKAGYQRKLR